VEMGSHETQWIKITTILKIFDCTGITLCINKLKAFCKIVESLWFIGNLKYMLFIFESSLYNFN